MLDSILGIRVSAVKKTKHTKLPVLKEVTSSKNTSNMLESRGYLSSCPFETWGKLLAPRPETSLAGSPWGLMVRGPRVVQLLCTRPPPPVNAY